MNSVLGMGNALVDVMTRLEGDKTLRDFKIPKGSMQLVTKEFSNRILASTLGLKKNPVFRRFGSKYSSWACASGIKNRFHWENWP